MLPSCTAPLVSGIQYCAVATYTFTPLSPRKLILKEQMKKKENDYVAII